MPPKDFNTLLEAFLFPMLQHENRVNQQPVAAKSAKRNNQMV